MTKQNRDAQFHALSDGTRRAVLDALSKGPAPASVLAAPHAMALPTFMAHLKVLEEAQLITTHKQGRSRICTLHPNGIADLHTWLTDRRAVWEAKLNAIEALLDTHKPN